MLIKKLTHRIFIYAKENIPTKQTPRPKKTRFSQAHANQSWAKSNKKKKGSRPKSFDQNLNQKDK